MCVCVCLCQTVVFLSFSLPTRTDSHRQLGQVPQSVAYSLLLKLACKTLRFLLLQLL